MHWQIKAQREGMVHAVPVPLATCSDHCIEKLSWPGIYDHLLLLFPLGKKHLSSLASLSDGIHLTLGMHVSKP